MEGSTAVQKRACFPFPAALSSITCRVGGITSGAAPNMWCFGSRMYARLASGRKSRCTYHLVVADLPVLALCWPACWWLLQQVATVLALQACLLWPAALLLGCSHLVQLLGLTPRQRGQVLVLHSPSAVHADLASRSAVLLLPGFYLAACLNLSCLPPCLCWW